MLQPVRAAACPRSGACSFLRLLPVFLTFPIPLLNSHPSTFWAPLLQGVLGDRLTHQLGMQQGTEEGDGQPVPGGLSEMGPRG